MNAWQLNSGGDYFSKDIMFSVPPPHLHQNETVSLATATLHTTELNIRLKLIKLGK